MPEHTKTFLIYRIIEQPKDYVLLNSNRTQKYRHDNKYMLNGRARADRGNDTMD